jgi:hypothetical protein
MVRKLSVSPSFRTCILAALLSAMVLAGCGSSAQTTQREPAPTTNAQTGQPLAHPQAIEPTAGVAGATAVASAAPDVVGDVNAHAPSLAQVKRELKQLNLCGGAVNGADATPVVNAKAPGFVPDPGTQQTEGQLPILTARLDALAKSLGVVIYGISGYRTPAHSVAVGGFADDPHTRGEAEDIGVGSLLRSSAAQISEAEFARFGLYRPFDPSDDPNNSEVNHIQLIPRGGPLTLAAATAAFDPDPSCK